MSKEDLVRHVSSALQNHIIDDEDTDMRRPGWFRGNELPDIGTMDEFARLSSENAKLKDEIESLKFSVGSGPCVTIVDMNEVPLPPEEIVSKKLKVNSSIYDSITKMASDVKGNSGEILGINIMKILELGIKNTGSTLIGHVIVDLTLNHIIAFRCGWEGLSLVSREGYLTNYVVKKELQNMYPEVTRFIPPDNIYMRYRIPRVPIGGTEYLPHLFVLGSIEGEKSSFILKYKIVGSMVMPIEGIFLSIVR